MLEVEVGLRDANFEKLAQFLNYTKNATDAGYSIANYRKALRNYCEFISDPRNTASFVVTLDYTNMASWSISGAPRGLTQTLNSIKVACRSVARARRQRLHAAGRRR